tara:strand:+ start:219 stop:734 length:516 start_codon:yes stop_codon:yes gene_type:complete
MSYHQGTGAYLRVEEDPDFGLGRYVADPFQVGQASLNGLGSADRGVPRHVFKEAQDFARGRKRAAPNYILRHNKDRYSLSGLGSAPLNLQQCGPDERSVKIGKRTLCMSKPSLISTLGSWAGSISGAYHGYKRNGDSWGWGIGWFILGGMFWPLTIPISVAQGYGKKAKKK